MNVRTILKFPHPGLATVSTPVAEFGGDLAGIAGDLLATMRSVSAIGITAPHIGVFLRLFIIQLPEEERVRFYVNPEMLWSSTEQARHAEGSVSMPGIIEEVERPRSIRFSYKDLQGQHHEEEAEGFHAACIQHEIDQLDGIFWIRRLSRLKRERLLRKWEKTK